MIMRKNLIGIKLRKLGFSFVLILSFRVVQATKLDPAIVKFLESISCLPEVWKKYLVLDLFFNFNEEFRPSPKMDLEPHLQIVDIVGVELSEADFQVRGRKSQFLEKTSLGYSSGRSKDKKYWIYFRDLEDPILKEILKRKPEVPQKKFQGVKLTSHATYLVWDDLGNVQGMIKFQVPGGTNTREVTGRGAVAISDYLTDLMRRDLKKQPDQLSFFQENWSHTLAIRVGRRNLTYTLSGREAEPFVNGVKPGNLLLPLHGLAGIKFSAWPLSAFAPYVQFGPEIEELSRDFSSVFFETGRFLARSWLLFGVMPELHHQNTLVEFNPKKKKIRRLLFRDLFDTSVAPFYPEFLFGKKVNRRALEGEADISREFWHHTALESEDLGFHEIVTKYAVASWLRPADDTIEYSRVSTAMGKGVTFELEVLLSRSRRKSVLGFVEGVTRNLQMGIDGVEKRLSGPLVLAGLQRSLSESLGKSLLPKSRLEISRTLVDDLALNRYQRFLAAIVKKRFLKTYNVDFLSPDGPRTLEDFLKGPWKKRGLLSSGEVPLRLDFIGGRIVLQSDFDQFLGIADFLDVDVSDILDEDLIEIHALVNDLSWEEKEDIKKFALELLNSPCGSNLKSVLAARRFAFQ